MLGIAEWLYAVVVIDYIYFISTLIILFINTIVLTAFNHQPDFKKLLVKYKHNGNALYLI